MEYIIVCRFSQDVDVSLTLLRRILNPSRGGGEKYAPPALLRPPGGEHAPPAIPDDDVAVSPLLFAYSITADDMESLAEVREIVAAAMHETADEYADQLRLDVDAIVVERGTIGISLFISHLVVMAQHAEPVVEGFAAWALPKLGDAVISAFGTALVGKLLQRLPHRESPKPALPASRQIRDYQAIAQKAANEVAHAHACKAVLRNGGLAVHSPKGTKTVAFLYEFHLSGLNGKGPEYLHVTVYCDGRRPNRIRPSDTPLEVGERPGHAG